MELKMKDKELEMKDIIINQKQTEIELKNKIINLLEQK
jgi:hypothetical protein